MTGGRYHHEDDQETPDSGSAVFDFGKSGDSWDDSSCHPRKEEDHPICAFYGDGGSLVIEDAGYRVVDPKGRVIEMKSGPFDDALHFQNFVDGIRTGAKLNSEIEDAQRSTLLCHLGNIAYRTGRTLRCDPASGKIIGDEDAARRYWGREYRAGWEPAA